MAKDSFKTVSFRLNVGKQDEREIYEYLENIDHGNRKQEFGDKSKFLKMLVKEWISTEVAREEFETQRNEEDIFQRTLIENLCSEVNKGSEHLVTVLPDLIRAVLKDVLADGVIAVAPRAKEEGTASQKEMKEVSSGGALPGIGAEIPEDAFDFIDSL